MWMLTVEWNYLLKLGIKISLLENFIIIKLRDCSIRKNIKCKT